MLEHFNFKSISSQEAKAEREKIYDEDDLNIHPSHMPLVPEFNIDEFMNFKDISDDPMEDYALPPALNKPVCYNMRTKWPQDALPGEKIHPRHANKKRGGQ